MYNNIINKEKKKLMTVQKLEDCAILYYSYSLILQCWNDERFMIFLLKAEIVLGLTL